MSNGLNMISNITSQYVQKALYPCLDKALTENLPGITGRSQSRCLVFTCSLVPYMIVIGADLNDKGNKTGNRIFFMGTPPFIAYFRTGD